MPLETAVLDEVPIPATARPGGRPTRLVAVLAGPAPCRRRSGRGLLSRSRAASGDMVNTALSVRARASSSRRGTRSWPPSTPRAEIEERQRDVRERFIEGLGGFPERTPLERPDHRHAGAGRLPGGDARLREPPGLLRDRQRLRAPRRHAPLPCGPRRRRAHRQRQGVRHLPARLDLHGEAGIPRPGLRPSRPGRALALLRPGPGPVAGGHRDPGAHPLRSPVPAHRPPLRPVRGLGRHPRRRLPPHPGRRGPRAPGGGRQLRRRHPGRLPGGRRSPAWRWSSPRAT